MAAGLGFKTFSTGDVLTAGDTNGYLMQGVWVFADAAARSAAVTSPQEGNISYLKDTNSTEYYSGAAWVAIGAAPASASYSLINTGGTSLSGGTTTVSGISGMSSLLIMVRDGSTAGATEVRFRINTDTGANYQAAGHAWATNTIEPGSDTNRTGGFQSLVVQSAANTFSLGVQIAGANSTGFKAVDLKGAAPGATASNYNYNSNGLYIGTSTVSSVSVHCVSSTFDAGTIFVYGSAV